MARRATSPSKKQTKAQTKEPAKLSKSIEAEMRRRGRKAKSVTPVQAEPSLTDIFFPGGEELADAGAKVASSPPAKARSGRKPKAQLNARTPAAMAANTGVEAQNAPPVPVSSSEGEEQSEVQIDNRTSSSVAARKTRRPRNTQSKGQSMASTDALAASQPTQPSAARWTSDTGMVTFDWPEIEQVASTNGPNQAMAKLLLAARAEGSNSRWPF